MDVLHARLRSVLTHLSRVIADSTPSQEAIESVLTAANQVHYLIVLLVDVFPGMDQNLPLVETVIHCLENIVMTNQPHNFGLPVVTFRSGERGRPRLVVPQTVLEYLIGNRFSVRQAALLLQVSASTVRRCMSQYGITVRSTYSCMSDIELDNLVTRLQQQHPNSGYRLIRGHLAAMGYRVQEVRITDSLRRVDPVGVASRWFQGIHRRTYSVPNPNALWHIDGNHKLIRYSLIM